MKHCSHTTRAGQSGFMLLGTLIFMTIALVLTTAITTAAVTNIKYAMYIEQREQAIHIAEAGVDYYRWHLAHAPQDFQNGQGLPGPYEMGFRDKDGNVIGAFTLTITPPVVGSTIVTVQSEGYVLDKPFGRTIRTRLAIPSLAKYAVVANDVMRFGDGTEVFGPLHSNNGIRFDGLAHNAVTSSFTSYDDPDHSGAVEFGVHTHKNAPPATGVNDTFRPLEAPPTTPVPNRTDVFRAGRQFPVPAFDFTGLTTDLAQIKANAQSSGRYISSSGAQGYRIVLKTNDTFDLYRVNNLQAAPNNCTNTANQTEWGTWSIRTTSGSQTFLANYAIPANGLIFVEDNVWVEGQINTARVTIAAGRFPNTSNRHITVNNDILYTNYTGTDVIALISQGNINVGLFSDTDLRIDAALVAQNGRVGRYYYENDCGSNQDKNQITLYGMIATNQRYGFAYTDGSGYVNRDIVYDGNLLYGPPPSFPLTSDQYQTISWEEI
jgi:hypothetical protein